ncbi:hypothetical protein DPMN_178946 [Dreissena polymorpha]|uniref:Uncharacterized protein n=1 Tax=Dreissena polymorpha TaxID=45954 RepID=A0A9D4ILP0_DREPO|nr:hypothetical protein DPMN_178946 [Dreissena polymorpha]
MYKDSSPQSRSEIVVTSADVHVDENATLQQQISQLSSDTHMLFSALRERVDQVEKCVEQKIINKVSQVLDKRINSEVNRLHKDIDTKMDTEEKYS